MKLKIFSFLICILSAMIIAVSVPMAPGALAAGEWAGEWQTYWREGQALMTLVQEGKAVSGVYEPQGGRIEGRVDGRLLRGHWRSDDVSGGILFALSSDGKTFTGQFDNGEYWNGRRVTDDEKLRFPYTAATSPRETLRTIVTSANEAVFFGNTAAMQIYAPLLHYEGPATDSRDRNRRRSLLWRLLNISTFRIYDAPARVDGDRAVFEIGPADAAMRYPLRFQRSRDGRWMLLVEAEARLKIAVDRFLDVMGYVSFEEMQNDRRNSPRGAMRAFLTGERDRELDDENAVLATLDLSFLPVHLRTAEGLILADYLKQVIDRIGFVVWQEIPNDPSRPAPYVFYYHPIGNITIQRVADPKGGADRWLFSAETLKVAPELFEAIQDLPLAPGLEASRPLTHFFQIREAIRAVSPNLLDRTLLLENWQWLGLIATIFISIAAAWAAGRLSHAAVFRMLRRSEFQASKDDAPSGVAPDGTATVDSADAMDAEEGVDAVENWEYESPACRPNGTSRGQSAGVCLAGDGVGRGASPDRDSRIHRDCGGELR